MVNPAKGTVVWTLEGHNEGESIASEAIASVEIGISARARALQRLAYGWQILHMAS